MAKEIQASYTTGATLYALVLKTNGEIWDFVASDWEAIETTTWGDYDIPMAEEDTTPGSGIYTATFPAAITAGVYNIIVRKQISGSPATTDPCVGDGQIHWNGSAEIPLSTIPWNANWDAEVQSEVDDALVAQKLDHLVAVADSDDVVNNSIMAKIAASDGDWSGFGAATDSLEALRDHIGDGTNLTEAGGTGDQLTGIPKTGYKLAADGLDSVTASEPSGKPTTFPGWIMWLIQRFRRSTLTSTTLAVKQEDGTTVTEQTVSDDGTTQSLGVPTEP